MRIELKEPSMEEMSERYGDKPKDFDPANYNHKMWRAYDLLPLCHFFFNEYYSYEYKRKAD